MSAISYVLSVNGLLFLMSIVFYYFPPKKINKLYGYRTYRTMSNDRIWKEANSTFNLSLLKFSGIGFAAAMLIAFVLPGLIQSWVPMLILSITLIVSIYTTEKTLNASYDSDGKALKKNRKK